MRQLLQNETENGHQKFITKCDRELLQSVSGITKCNRLLLQNASGLTKCDSYYKVRRNISSHLRNLKIINQCVNICELVKMV